jgi:hypothetical protein
MNKHCTMNYAKYPQTCNAMAFMMEADSSTIGLKPRRVISLTASMRFYANLVWNDPKRIVFRDGAKRSLTDAGLGSTCLRASAPAARTPRVLSRLQSVNCNVSIANSRLNSHSPARR